MAKNGKKQGVKSKTTKVKSSVAKNSTAKNTAKNTAKSTVKSAVKNTTKNAKAVKNTKTAKSTKKPASFSKNAEAKKASKKENPNFAEFETLKLGGSVEKLDSKIILRDVERETPIKPLISEIKPVKKVKKEIQPQPQPQPQPVVTKPSAKEIKEKEIEKAIKNATKIPEINTRSRKRRIFGEFGLKRAALATVCLTTAIFAVVYFINLASSNISIQSAAAQSGIDAKYPSYVPRGYDLSDITSSSGKVIMHFKSGGDEFGLSEEISSWDSDALLNSYIKPNYGNDYTVIREQGLTLYMGDNWEAWVNGGMLYKLTVDSGSLTKKQMKTIATSL